MAKAPFKKGDKVKWTGIGRGSRVDHEGVVLRLLPADGSVEVTEDRGVNKRTGKPNKVRLYVLKLSRVSKVS